MSQQMTDPFIWENEEWIFLRADNIYSLFNPESFGLTPTEPHTACWKGFIAHFKVSDNDLYLHHLQVYCKNGKYPPINGITPKKDNEFMLYKNLNLKLSSYSGTIIIGKEMYNNFMGRAFTGPHSYSMTLELDVQNGKIISSKDTSGTYTGF